MGLAHKSESWAGSAKKGVNMGALGRLARRRMIQGMLPPPVRQPAPPPLAPWCSPLSGAVDQRSQGLPQAVRQGSCGFYELQKIESFIYFGKIYILA
jgi:hypothetical protein